MQAKMEVEKREKTGGKKTLSWDITPQVFPSLCTNDLQTPKNCHKCKSEDVAEPYINAEKNTWKFRRAENYRLQGIIRNWFCDCGRELGLKYPVNYHQTAKCLYTRYKGSVNIAKDEKQAFYLGLVRCARIWTCPVCATKIQQVRKKEVRNVIDWAYKNGYRCMMITFTFPHYLGQSADGLMKRFSKALAYFRGGKQWQNIKSQLGFTGLIRGLEVTRGDNGWHIHTHEIWIVSKSASVTLPVEIKGKLGLVEMSDIVLW